MPLASFDAQYSNTEDLPPYQPSLVERGTSAIFSVLDAPANAARSVVRAAQTGDSDYLYNAVKSLIPFAGSEEVKAEDITGQPEAYWKNLAVTVALDPLLPVSGIGELNEAGKLAQIAKRADLALRAGKTIERVAPGYMAAERLGELVSAADEARAAYRLTKIPKIAGYVNKTIEDTVDALRSKGLTDETIQGIVGQIETPKRSLVTLGIPFTPAQVQLGDYEKLQKLMANLKLLPDPAIPVMTERIAKLEPKLRAAQRVLDEKTASLTSRLTEAGLTDETMQSVIDTETQKENLRITTLQTKLDKANTALEGADKGLPVLRDILTPEQTNTIRKVLESTGKLFRHDARDEYQKAITEVMNFNIAGDTSDLVNAKKLQLSTRLNELKDIASETPEAFNQKMVLALESIGDKKYAMETADLWQKIKELDVKFEARKNLLEAQGTFDPAAHEVKYKNALTTLKNQQLALDLRFQESAKTLGALSQEEMSFVNEFHKVNNDFVPLAQKLGLPVDFLQTAKGLLEYAPRLISEDALALKKSDPIRYNSINNTFKNYFKNAAKRSLYPELSIPAINANIKNDFKVNFDFFKTDIADMVTEIRRRQTIAIHKAAAVNALVGAEGTARKTLSGDIKASNLFSQLGLAASKAPKKWIPQTVKNDALGLNDFFLRSVDKEGLIQDAFNLVDRKANLWRSLYTSILPSFHVRNEINNVAMNSLGAKARTGDYLEAARAQFTEGHPLVKEAIEHGVLNKGQVATYGRELNKNNVIFKVLDLDRPITGTIEQIAKKFLGVDFKVGYKMDPFVGRAFGQFIEENARLAHYIARKRLGDNAFDAARSVNKWLFDYTKLTGFERKYVKPLFTFYQWHRNNMPLVLNTVLTHPRYAAAYAKITGIGKEEAPNYLRGQAAFKAPPSFGENQYVGSLGLGVEDLFLLSAADAEPSGNIIGSSQQIKRLGEKALSQLNPLLRIPLEIASGRDFYRGRDLSKTQIMDYVNRVLPTSTAYAKLGKFSDDNTTMTSAWVNLMSGLRVYGVNPKSVEISAARRQLFGSGKVIGYEIPVPAIEGDKIAKDLISKYNKIVKQKD